MTAALLKHQINPALMQQIATLCQQQDAHFAADRFLQLALPADFEQLELKQRIRCCASALYQALDRPFAAVCQLLLPVSEHFPGIPGFIFPDVVEQFGLDEPETAFSALAHFTCFSTAEFAIRPFLLRYPAATLQQMQIWAQSDNHHLRRLASEGCRPRLPWGQALRPFKLDPSPLLPILQQLKADPSDYVRRSVANHLNDISKDHPQIALTLASAWYGQHPATDWIVRHGLRGLLKQRHPQALQLFGYQNVAVCAQLTLSTVEIRLGERLEFRLHLSGYPTERIRLEYIIDFAGKHGGFRAKVFQWQDRVISEPTLQLSRSYLFKDLTTRKHYAGTHQLSIIVNGQRVAQQSFQVLPASSSTSSVGF
jgi:3-methyladenine DNA glycosylase AlkC